MQNKLGNGVVVDAIDSVVLNSIITVVGAVTYIAEALAGTFPTEAAWRVQKIDATTGTVITWADKGKPTQIATDLTVLTYS